MRGIGVLLVAFLALFPRFASAEPDVSPVVMTANLEKSVCTEGQPVVLVVTFHNNSATALFTGGSAFDMSSFQFAITNAKGQAVPRTVVGDRLLTPPTIVISNRNTWIGPGKEERYRFNLARMFDLSRVGDYHVRLSKYIRDVFRRSSGISSDLLTTAPLTVHMTADSTSFSGPVQFTKPRTHSDFLFLGNQGKPGHLRTFRIEADGGIANHEVDTATGYSNPTSFSIPLQQETGSLTATPNGQFLYLCNGDNSSISQFRIGQDGTLSPLAPATVTAQRFTAFLVMDPHGRYLWALSGWGNTRYSIGSDGRLTMQESVPYEKWQKDQAHQMTPATFGAIDTAGKVLFTGRNDIESYRLADDGSLLPMKHMDVPPQADFNYGARAIALTPSGRFAFVLKSNSPYGKDDTVVSLRVEADGSLTALPGEQKPGVYSEMPHYVTRGSTALAVDPSGRFLLVVNPICIVRYRIGPDGSLTSLGRTSPPNAGVGEWIKVAFSKNGQRVFAIARAPGFTAVTAYTLNDAGDLTSEWQFPQCTGPLFSGALVSNVPIAPPDDGKQAKGIAISARIPRDEYPVTQPTVLTVVLKNVTTKPIRLRADMASFRLSLMGPMRSPDAFTGKNVTSETTDLLLDAGHDLLNAKGKSTEYLVLPPGGQREYRFFLSRLADLTYGGNYGVAVHYTFPDGTILDSQMVYFQLDGPRGGAIQNNANWEIP